MRNILFRGKSIDFNMWIAGDLSIVEGRPYILVIKRISDGELKSMVLEVVPDTVGEWTGLFDKNRRIFEGDIIKGHNSLHEDRLIYRVVYESNGFYYMDEDDVTWHPDNIDNVEIIGNVHDNPELMEVK